MGIFLSCCKGSSNDLPTPGELEIRRRQAAEAADRRLREQENRGIKDLDKMKRMQMKSDELERRERENVGKPNDTPLKWQMN